MQPSPGLSTSPLARSNPVGDNPDKGGPCWTSLTLLCPRLRAMEPEATVSQWGSSMLPTSAAPRCAAFQKAFIFVSLGPSRRALRCLAAASGWGAIFCTEPLLPLFFCFAWPPRAAASGPKARALPALRQTSAEIHRRTSRRAAGGAPPEPSARTSCRRSPSLRGQDTAHQNSQK